jgi:K+-transporting ATPase ATPase C chain
MVLVFTLITGLAYPLVVTGIAQLFFEGAADGSFVENADGERVGSAWIGQNFTEPQYFHPRPSSAGEGYDGSQSLGSNLGPTNDALLDAVAERVVAYREENGLADDDTVPVDAVTGSSSGLDPHISVANARIQAPRVADARGMDLDEVMDMVDEHTDGRALGFLGEPGVNVLLLNMALDGVNTN